MEIAESGLKIERWKFAQSVISALKGAVSLINKINKKKIEFS